MRPVGVEGLGRRAAGGLADLRLGREPHRPALHRLHRREDPYAAGQGHLVLHLHRPGSTRRPHQLVPKDCWTEDISELDVEDIDSTVQAKKKEVDGLVSADATPRALAAVAKDRNGRRHGLLLLGAQA